MVRFSHVLRALVLFLGLVFSAREAAAQGSVYVEATGFADIKRFGSTSDIYYYGGGDEFSLDGTGAGGGLRVGTFLHPRLSLELAIDAGTTTSSDMPDPYAILAIYPPLPRRDTEASTRFLSISTVVGYHPPARGRLRLGYLAGFSFVRGVYKSSDYPVYILAAESLPGFASAAAASGASAAFSTIYPPPDLTVTQRDMTTGAILGFEAAIDLTKHIAIVPEVRALTFSMPNSESGVFLIRPGIGVRFTY